MLLIKMLVLFNANPNLRLSVDGGSSYVERYYYWGHVNINSDSDNDIYMSETEHKWLYLEIMVQQLLRVIISL